MKQDDSMTSLKEGTMQIWASKSMNADHDVEGSFIPR